MFLPEFLSIQLLNLKDLLAKLIRKNWKSGKNIDGGWHMKIKKGFKKVINVMARLAFT